jgi:2-polyprenyl-3-methyl-5-hydroxy-6-metoxy-1,4-benzoquinol methylase
MSLYRLIRSGYHVVVPQRVRHWVFVHSPSSLSRVRNRVVTALEEAAPHDHVYDKNYYEKIVEPTMVISVAAMAESIHKIFKPPTVVDLGCGTGTLLMALKERGISGQGFEYATAAIETCRSRGLVVSRLNIETDPCPDVRAHTAISTEVAEHLPGACAERFVEMLTTMAESNIVLTAATPGQGGTDHINEQPNSYWISKVEARGFRYQSDLTLSVRSQWSASGVAHCFAGTVMIFSRNPR